ncbi:rRNA maturation RNase YbeY [Patescibacteria group bacterium]|nr:rRNA maturation RNase YbeY [Patescibacteria group bacterium]MBU1028697.1 rRNA maturation RNase YbeY [Patescibacteria group bacterium]MBU1915962.1 rRNA maturation RNase YbeY [Patescibacteria group bacterium]
MKVDMVSADISGQLPSGVTANFVKKIIDLAYQSSAGYQAVHVDISIVTDQEMQRLNRIYRGVDSTTDVLSFSYIDDSSGIFIDATDESSPSLLGEIVISSEQIHRQAIEKKCEILQEFALMLVHGVLHLMGHDHTTTQDEIEMFSLQQRIMNLINGE